jgi:hypothetical protein
MAEFELALPSVESPAGSHVRLRAAIFAIFGASVVAGGRQLG